MYKNLTIISLLGVLAIALGAFGAHALKEVLTPQELASFETGVRYQMYHVIVLLFVTIFEGFTIAQKNKINLVFLLGIFLFSGSIYVIHLTSVTAKQIWFVTPLGGVTLLLGWILMIVIFLKKAVKN
ncbi:DUF423 domain-containing protein [uncultured Polaribacter sp.]|uniref:DUF423 domain-containing protein n=1 Tax=uncultured Polaribacter sp. TaxID=174711 RepID=UPI00261A98C0|nr:DUF423 domain-containing protein [uncultured Polaribacter sp.]